jgi:hypothetical protein
MRQYQSTWNAIKTTGKASVTVSREHARTVTAGVIEIKSDENRLRKMAGLMGWSKLVIKTTRLSDTRVRIDFSLAYSTNL